MKSLLLIASSLIILSSAFAEIVTVDVPAGYNAVVLSHTRHLNGDVCVKERQHYNLLVRQR